MSLEIEFIPGPLTSQMTRTAAITALKQHPNFRKNSAYAVEQLEGRWVAAIVHQAGPPPFGGGAPADSEEESPGPKSEGPDDTAPSDDGPPKDDDGDSDGPPSGDEGGDSGPPKAKGGEGHEIKMIADMLTQIMQALGLPPAMGDSMVPGMDPGAAPPGPPMGGPPGAGGPPPPPHGGPPGGPPPPHGGPPGMPPKMMQHQRALKPGETPPGGTPIGAPAFAHVNPEHPWAHMVGHYASFKVADKIADRPLSEVEAELQQLAATSGYRVARFDEGRDDDGDRIALATISVH